MISPVPSSTPVNQALTDLRSSIGALNGERSQLERHEPGSNYQEIEAAVDYILGLATSKVQSASPDETLVLGNGSNRISLVEKLDQVAALLESDQQRAALSDVISSNGVDQSLQKIQKLRSDLDLLHTSANKQQADPFLATVNFTTASTPVPGSSVAPTRFEDQYSIVGKIGEGGMGTVLRVRNDKLERDEAAKMIQPRPGESESDQQMKLSRFREEVRISAQLAPAGFVQTYDIFTTADNKVGFTMELIEGGVNLERLIRAYKEVMFKSEAPSQKQPGRAALEATVLGFDATADNAEIETDGPSSPDAKLDARAVLSQVLRITPSGKDFSRTEQKSLTKALVDKLIDVCHNVQIMHELGFIHRDIKPANILIDKQGKVRLADAGLAEEIERLKTKAPGISGTPQYMAPEQIIGDPKREGVHTDIYGIGAILYEVICGKTQITVKPDAPFSLAMLNPIKDGTIPKAIRPGIFGFTFHDLEAVCQKAMAPDPEKRFQSVAQLADELTAWVRGAEVPTYATSAPPAVRLIYGLGSRIANHPFMTLGLSGGTLATFVGGFFGLKALDAKSEFDRLSVRAVEVYRKNDPDALGASLELHRQAHTVIAPYALTFENLGFSDIGRNTLVRREIEHEISERRQASALFERFTRDAGSALRAASSDFSTYYATDRTARLLEQALSEQIPDMFDPRAANALIESLSHRALEPEERREIIFLTAQCFESRASKLPFHPDLGLKHAGDAERGMQLLKNARRLYQEAEVPLSTSELMLELRFRRDMLKVAEGRSSFRAQPDHANTSAQTQRIEPLKIEIERLNAKLVEVPPVTARDYYTLGKIAFFDRADDVEALRCFEKALEILEPPEGDNPVAQDPSITFGAMYGKGQALVRLGRSEEANTAFSEARRAIKNLNLDESMGSDLFAMTTSKVAHSYLVSYTARYGGDTANLTPEQNETIVSLYDQSNRASPHNIAILNAYGHYLLKRNDSERALAIYSDLVTSHPEFNYGFAQRGFINAQLGRIDAAFCDYLDASGISSTSVAPDQVFATLERRITNEPQFLLENDNIDMLWKYATGLAICANKALEAQDIEKADRYYRLTLKVMDISVTWVENRNGYGKDTLLIYEYFRTLSDRYPEDFDKLFERLKPFENFQSFRGSY